MSRRGKRGGRGRRRSTDRHPAGSDRPHAPAPAPPPVAPVAAPPPRWSRALEGLVPFAGPAVLAVAGAGMVALTWRTWPDPIVDYGREIYLAWRVAEGDTLYVDARHFSGPLSVHLNALWIRLFGPGIMTLAVANLALAVGFIALLYSLVARLAGRVAATAACVFFIVSFACAHYTIIANYNWICPYSHELTHGVMLVVAGLACVARYQDGRRLGWLALAGVTAGLLVLTKVEAIVAGMPALLLALGLTMAWERPTPARMARIVAVVGGAAILPLVLTAAWFAPVMSVEEILRWPLGHWQAVQRSGLATSTFYRRGMGIDDVPRNLAEVGAPLAAWVAVVGAAALFGRSGVRHPLAVAALFVAAYGCGGLLTARQWTEAAARPLLLVVATVSAGAVVGFLHRRREPSGATCALWAALGAFAIGLLVKMALNVRLYNYGFALAAPAAIVVVAALVGWLPAAVARAGGRSAPVRAVILGFLVAAMASHVSTTKARVDGKRFVIGQGRDAFRTGRRGFPIQRLLGAIDARVGEQETIVAFPEGVLVNYLVRRRNPTPYYLFDRTTFLLWGEDDAAAALAADPPDWVALVDRGRQGLYAHGLLQWVQGAYVPVWQFGWPEFKEPTVATMLMRRTLGHGPRR